MISRFWNLIIALMAFAGAASVGAEEARPSVTSGPAILAIAHGGSEDWNRQVKEAVAELKGHCLAEVGFLMGVPDRRPEEAYRALIDAGAAEVVIVPLFVSSHSDHYEQVRFLAGLRADYPHAEHMQLQRLVGPAKVLGVTSALDDNPHLERILNDRARALSAEARGERLILVAHGPNDDETAAIWIANLDRVAAGVQERLGLAAAEVRLLRDDAPPEVKDVALAQLRGAVATSRERVLVVPVLLATGKVLFQIPEVLKGLSYAWDGTPLIPHPALAEWIEQQARELAAGRSTTQMRPHEDVIVTATRTRHSQTDSAVETTLVSSREIEAAQPRSVADIISRQVGLDAVPTLGGQGIRIQGFSPRHVLLLVDGVEVCGKIGSSVDASTLTAEGVDHIEVVRGATSALYGSEALGGVINVITKSPQSRLSTAMTTAFESNGGRSFSGEIGSKREAWDAVGHFGLRHRDSYDLTPEDPGTTGGRFDRYHGDMKVSRALGGSNRISFSSRFYDEEARDITLGRGALYDDRTGDRRVTNSVGIELKPTALSDLSMRVSHGRFWHTFERTTSAAAVLSTDRDRQDLTEIVAQYTTIVGSHGVSVGGELERASISASRVPGSSRRLETAVAFAQDEVTLGSRLMIAGGLRYDANSVYGGVLSPRIAVGVRATPNIIVRAAYGQGFKAPDFKELYIDFGNRAAGYKIVGNPDLDPETSRSFSSSLWINAGGGTDLRVSAFRHRISNLIDSYFVRFDPASSTSIFSYRNTASATLSGVEVEGNHTIGGAFSIGGGYMFLRARDGLTGYDLLQRPVHRGVVKLFYENPKSAAQVTIRAAGRQGFSDTNGDGEADELAPSNVFVDLRVARRIFGGFESFAGIENLLDHNHPRYLPIEGRRIYAGVTYTFDGE
ncbi:MAG: TonB-dependent receptor [Acidobacteria bacterium]|nr:TonB-dependent receptor [Acidobacteriota bacterium]